MDDQNKEQNNQNQMSDMRSVNPEVIGHLRKDKIGDPGKALLWGILLITVLIALPFATELLSKDIIGNPIIDTGGIDIDNPSGPKFLDATKNQQLNGDLVMKYENIVIKKCYVDEKDITCTINSFTGVLNLDEEDYFLAIASKQGNDLGYIKLTGQFDNQEIETKLTTSKINFNSGMTYFGRIVKLEEKDYPDFSLTASVDGTERLTCTKDNRTIEYLFKGNLLTGINDQLIVKTNEFKNMDLYRTEKGKYDDRAKEIGNKASVEEAQQGFVFRASIDLLEGGLPKTVTDYDYYEKDTTSKKVDFLQISKGFDCK